jgi:acetyl-CoA carboxylase carboxyltransferase component
MHSPFDGVPLAPGDLQMTVTGPQLAPSGTSPALGTVRAPVRGTVVAIEAVPGQACRAGQTLVVLESMKMEVPLACETDADVLELMCGLGEVVEEGAVLLTWRPAGQLGGATSPGPAQEPREQAAELRADLARLQARRALLQDAARPEAIARRHASGLRSARENVADLLDAGSFSEMGAFAVAAQSSRRSEDDLQRHTPADGLITGTGTVDGRPCAVMAYDYTVLAGTQGVWNHAKSDRLLEVARRSRLPVVLFAEGGGGRPGDVDWPGVAGLDCTTFASLAALSGQVPLVGIVAGRCFAGNAALLGCCDLIIAVEGASIGLGGPAMIEGGGLGRVEPDAVGPVDVHWTNGVVDVRVSDEAAAITVARQWLGFVAGASGATGGGVAGVSRVAGGAPSAAVVGERATTVAGGDPASLREALPAQRNTAFDPRPILQTVCDAGSLLELRQGFGPGVVTAVARLGGRPVSLMASDCRHLGGALDGPACDKLERFLRLADAWAWPVITFVDTPGFMVGPDSERTGLVRRAGDLFIAAARLRVPLFSVMLRRGFGLGAMALAGGHFHAPRATCAWPGAEFGPMGLEGAVRLGFRKELQAQPEGPQREALFQRLLAQAVDRGQALNMASHLEIDDVIDPAETRDWLLRQLVVAG